MQNDKFIPQESKLKKYQLEFLNKIIARQMLFGPILKAFNRERILNGRYTKRNDYWEFVGYNILGPILHHFSEWIIAQANKHDIKRVFFLARDGWIIKKAVDLILKSSQYNISTCYLFASRRCYNLPALASIEDSDFHFLFDGGRRHSALTLFNKLGISKEKISPLVTKYFSNPEEIIDQSVHYRKLEALFMEASNIIAEHAAEERKVLVNYFKKNGVYDEKIIIVDIGWHGSLQRAVKKMSQIEGKNCDIKGLYFGLFDSPKHFSRECDMNAYFFNYGIPSENEHLIKQSVEVIELLFSAPHCGVEKITQQDGQFKAVFTQPTKHEKHRQHISKQLYHGAMQFIIDFDMLFNGVTLPFTPRNYAAPLETLLTSPSNKDIEMFSKVHHAAGFGAAHYEPLIPPKISFPAALFSPRVIIKKFERAFWPRGYEALQSRGVIRFSYRSARFLSKIKKLLLQRLVTFN